MSKRKPVASPARKVAWHIAQDINWIAIYRTGMAAMASLIFAMVAWQSNRIINRQDAAGTEIAQLRTDVETIRTGMMFTDNQVSGLAADIIKGEMRVNRANERQTEMSNALAVLESRVEDLRQRVK